MKGKWIAECNEIARQIKDRPGQLIGVAVDNDTKGDAFVKYWKEKHPHIEVVKRFNEIGVSWIQIRLAGQLQ